jgi:hypothetical protein
MTDLGALLAAMADRRIPTTLRAKSGIVRIRRARA